MLQFVMFVQFVERAFSCDNGARKPCPPSLHEFYDFHEFYEFYAWKGIAQKNGAIRP